MPVPLNPNNTADNSSGLQSKTVIFMVAALILFILGALIFGCFPIGSMRSGRRISRLMEDSYNRWTHNISGRGKTERILHPHRTSQSWSTFPLNANLRPLSSCGSLTLAGDALSNLDKLKYCSSIHRHDSSSQEEGYLCKSPVDISVPEPVYLP